MDDMILASSPNPKQRTNEIVISQLKSTLVEKVSKLEYSFTEEDRRDWREPNEKEIRQWMKSQLKHIYFTPGSNHGITTSQYRSLKGEIRHGSFTGVFNFLKKRGITDDLEERMIAYSKLKCFKDVTVSIPFPEVIKRVTIDIDVNRKES